MLDQVFGVLFMLLLWALAIHYFRKHALARFVEWKCMWALDLDPEIKELIKKAWRVLKALLLYKTGVDYQMERGEDCARALGSQHTCSHVHLKHSSR